MTTALSPLAYALTLGTSSVAIVPSNPSRKGIIFFNPSSNTVAVCPAFTASGQALPAVVNGAGSINLLPNATLMLPPAGNDKTAGVGAAWNAIASGAATPFTVWEF
jgi:hypothetical protein